MTDVDQVAPGAVEAWRRHLGEEIDAGALRSELARGSLPQAEELAAHARERLSAYKCPKRFFLVEQIPRNEMGKVLRDELVQMAGERA